MTHSSKNKRTPEQDNYFWLLFAILLFFFMSAIAEQLNVEMLGRIMAISITIIILIAVWSMSHHRLTFSSRMIITLLLVLTESSNMLFAHYHLDILQLVSLLLFSVFTITVASQHVLLRGSVNANKIFGAICIYLLMGVAWAVAYLLVEQLFPGSIPTLSGDNWRQHLQEALYFSYITLSTLGFGDIIPTQPIARYLTYMQAIVGQFYLAIVIASLIGAKILSSEEVGSDKRDR